MTTEYIVRPPLVLPLAARCFALMAQSVPTDGAAAFRERIGARLDRGGALLERRFARLRPGEGLTKLRQSFALIIGLWQMAAASGCAERRESDSASPATSPVSAWNYRDELARALAGLWQTVGGAPPPAPT